MYHPIIGNRKAQITFVAWWIALMAIHSAIFSYYYNISLTISIIDSAISNVFYALLSLGLWYWVRLSDIETSKPINILVNHLGAVSLSVVALVFLQKYILGSIFSDNSLYLEFLNKSLIVRAIAGTLIYLTVVLVYYLFIYVQNFREKLSREGELKALVKDAELNWLKLQVNPHFLFNSLNSVSSLTMTSPEKAQEMIIRLSELLRYSLKQSPDSMVTLENELDNCIKYLEIEKVRFGSRLNYSIDTTPECLLQKVPGMIIQPLFENAIKHSVAQSAETSEILAKISLQRSSVVINISNSIPTDSVGSSGTGVGLENIRRRLVLIYGMSNLLSVSKTETTFSANLVIPFDNDK